MKICITECPISPLPFPKTPEINNCLQLFAYIQSQGASTEQWCQNPNNQKQCCLTCSSSYFQIITNF